MAQNGPDWLKICEFAKCQSLTLVKGFEVWKFAKCLMTWNYSKCQKVNTCKKFELWKFSNLLSGKFNTCKNLKSENLLIS